MPQNAVFLNAHLTSPQPRFPSSKSQLFQSILLDFMELLYYIELHAIAAAELLMQEIVDAPLFSPVVAAAK